MAKRDFENFFEQFETIYQNKEQYNITWAFKDAQMKLDDFRNEVIGKELKSKCFMCKDRKKVDREYNSMKLKSAGVIKRHKLFSSLFEIVYNLLSIVEFFISFALVLAISELSHSPEMAVWTKAFSMYVVVIFAFIKVVLEQFVLKPKLELFGWRLYYKSVKVLKDLTESFDEQLVLDRYKYEEVA